MRERSIDRLFRRYRDHRDARALAELFDRVAPELARIATHFSKTSDEVEDAVQTAFLTAIERPEMVDPDRPFLPWMIGVVTNRCRDLARKRGRTPEPDRLPVREVVDPASHAEAFEFQSAVERSVEMLAPKYRSAVHAHLAEGLAAREIAKREGITPNAASVRLHRGLRALRKALPAGFALGAAGLVGTPALAGVRTQVLQAATGSKAAVAVGAQKGWGLAALAVLGGTLSLAALVFFSSPNEASLEREADALARGPKASESKVEAAPQQAIVAPTAQVAREVAKVQVAPKALVASESPQFSVHCSVTGEPVEGAWVRAESEGDLLGRTGEDGTLLLGERRTLDEIARVDAPGFVSWRRSRLALNEQAGVEGYRHAVPQAGDSMRILLDPGAAKRGVVLDHETREPIAGALVYAFEKTRKMPDPVADRPVGITDRTGAFTVDGGVPLTNESGGNVLLFAVAPETPEFRERSGSLSFPVLEAAEGEPVEILCRPSLKAEVTVLDESGQPLPGVTVAARPGSPPWGLDWTSKESLTRFERSHPPELLAGLSAVTDARGVARFERLTAGGPSGMTAKVPYELLWAFGFELVDEAWSGTLEREFLTVAGVEQFELRAKRNRVVHVRGRCVTESGVPIAAVRVGHTHPEGRSTMTSDEGYFDLGTFVSTQFPLKLSAHSDSWCSAGAHVPLPETGQDDVHLELVHARAVELRGRLVDENGRGVVGARLLLLGAYRGGRVESQAPGGEFEFQGVEAGTHELRVAAPDGRTLVAFVEAGLDRVEVRLPSKERETSLVLDLVEEGENGEIPVPTSVSFTNEMGGTFKGGHDSLGAITHSPRRVHREPGLIRAEGVPAGSWTVSLQCEGFPEHTLTIDLEPESGVVRREVTLQRAGQITVRTTGAKTDGPEGGAVLVDFTRIHLSEEKDRDRPLQYWHLEQISAVSFEPVFEFELTPGPWWVSVNQEGRAGFMHVDVSSGENPRIDLALQECARLEIPPGGLKPGQTPLLDLRVGIGGTRVAPRADYDANGLFYLVPPEALEWRVYVIGDRKTGAVQELARGSGKLAPGETRVIEL